MLIKLLPVQLVKVWDMIRYAIAETFIPRNSCTNEHLQVILRDLLSGKRDIWMAVEADKKFIGFVVTRIAVEAITGERCLFIDNVYAFQGVPEKILIDGTETLNKYAKKNNCKTMVALTEDARIARLAEHLKFSQRYYLFREV